MAHSHPFEMTRNYAHKNRGVGSGLLRHRRDICLQWLPSAIAVVWLARFFLFVPAHMKLTKIARRVNRRG